jgi:hypothetical protein
MTVVSFRTSQVDNFPRPLQVHEKYDKNKETVSLIIPGMNNGGRGAEEDRTRSYWDQSRPCNGERRVNKKGGGRGFGR